MGKGPLKVSKAQLERIQDYIATFNTPAGKRVLEDLEAEYGGECFVKGDLYETLHRTSCRDFFDRIKMIVKLEERGLEVEEEQKEEKDA